MAARLLARIWQRPYALLPLPPLFWAGNLLIGRAWAAELPPFGLTFWRWVVAALVILPLAWRELAAKRREVLAHGPVILACSAFGFAGYPVLNYLGLRTTPAATAAMLNSSLPLMVPVFAWALLREVPAPRTIAGILLSLVGVAWIVGRGDWTALAALSIDGGEILVLLAVAGYALYSVLLRYRPRALSDRAFLAAMALATAILTAPCWAWEAATDRAMPTDLRAIGAVLFIGIFASLAGNAIWNRCVATLGSTLTGASFHLVAVYSSVLAWLVLGEPIRLYHWAGIVLILAGFALAAGGQPRAARANWRGVTP